MRRGGKADKSLEPSFEPPVNGDEYDVVPASSDPVSDSSWALWIK